MRQFSYLTWDAYEQVYSLVWVHSEVSERASALEAADLAMCAWYDSWYHDSGLSQSPYGIVMRLRECLSVRPATGHAAKTYHKDI
jgi:hypothetical protein